MWVWIYTRLVAGRLRGSTECSVEKHTAASRPGRKKSLKLDELKMKVTDSQPNICIKI